MITLSLAGGIVLLLIVGFALTRSAPAIEFADDDPDWEVWDDEAEEPPDEATPAARFVSGGYYRWEAIEDLLWAYGYTRDEVQAAWRQNYVQIYRNGLHAEFDGTLFPVDRDGEPLYTCHIFDTRADTSNSDRWRRQPTDDERRRAVWR